MAKDINLLPKIIEKETKRDSYRRFGSILSFSLIGVVVLTVVSFFAWSLLLDRSLGSVENAMVSRQEGIQDNLDKELKLRAIVSKVKLIKPLIASDHGYSDIVTKLQEVAQVSPSVETNEVILEGVAVVFSGRAPNSQTLEDYITALLDPQIGGQSFSKVFLTSLARSETLAEYRFSLKMNYLLPSETGDKNADR